MTLRLDGALTVREVSVTRHLWLTEIGLNPEPVVELDATELQKIDTAGVQLLLALRREVEGRGGQLRLRAGSGQIEEQFAKLGLEGWS